MAGKHSREHAGENTESKRHGKSAHGATTEVKKERGAHKHGQVGVKHGAECPGEASPNCALDGLLHPKFFTNALEDDTIGIHCHSDGQDCTTDGGQRECCMQHEICSHENVGIDDKTNAGDETQISVHDEHPDDDEEKGNHGRQRTAADKSTAERRSNNFLGDRNQLNRKRTTLQQQCIVAGLLSGEPSGDDTLTVGDGCLDCGAHQYLAIKVDGDLLPNVRLSSLRKSSLALRVERKGNLGFAETVRRLTEHELGVLQVLATDDDLAILGLELEKCS